jgi:acetyl-CoA carboxylase biotin carboxyl carrier protein
VELKQIKELMAAMEKMGVKRLRLKEKEKYELELELKDENAPHPSMPPFYVHPEAHRFPTTSAHPHREPVVEAPRAETRAEEKNGKYITSPMVGTFYAAPNPESPPFVKAGDTIKEGMVVCIIEAMKVMNEIKADKSGTVVKIHAENGHPVEFGTKLFEIV